jgi:RNA polymerase sigma-70 factor (ECF subfamily)
LPDEIRPEPGLAPLIERARAGDEAAFERLVRRHYERIHRWSLTWMGDPDDADDVTQEALVRLHRSLETYDGRARFTTWLYRVVRNVALDARRSQTRLRRRRRNLARRTPEASEEPVGVGRIVDERAVALVRVFFDELSDRQREAFDLVDLQGHTTVEAAEMMDVDPVTVRTHVFRARRILRSRMLEEHPELVGHRGPDPERLRAELGDPGPGDPGRRDLDPGPGEPRRDEPGRDDPDRRGGR